MTRKQKVQVWIFGEDSDGSFRVLLLKTLEHRGSFWQPVTGSVDTWETLQAAALREAREETGIDFAQDPAMLDYAFDFDVFHETCFYLDAGKCRPVTLDPHEHQAHQWVEPTQALSILKFESNREALKKLLQKLGTKRCSVPSG